MVEIISKYIIKEEDTNAVKREKYGSVCCVLGILLNICLSLSKLIIGIIANSIAIIADAINNISDAASSIVSICGFKISKKVADADHPFGHR